jgi:large subunit ribosomal protein L21
LQEDEGDIVSINKVLLVGDGDNITLGAPAIEGAFAEAKVLGHLKGDKVIVFKKKRRKGYRKKNGHRQYLSQIQITSLSLDASKKKDSSDSASAKAKTEKAADKKVTPVKAEDAPKGKVAKKEVEVSENLVTRAENRSEDNDLQINIDKVLHNIGTATKAEAQDLKLINGIGPAYEKRLNEVGIYTYEQISKLKAADRDELSAIEGVTREKIESEEWVKQAKALLKKK